MFWAKGGQGRACSSDTKALWIAGAVMLVFVLAEIAAICVINSGKFGYTLDDAYIHLSLAENIWRGHYGINSNEFAAPSSSILWPFIISPFAATRYGEYAPLLINIAAALGTLCVFRNILSASIPIANGRERTVILSVLLVLMVLGTNAVGLIFTGMEHSLQLLAVSIIIWGMITEIETNRSRHWLLSAIVLAPLIRYECLAVSAAALGFLYYREHQKEAVILAIVTLVPLILFSVFLMSLGLGALPTSVLAKAPVTNVENMRVVKLLGYNLGYSISKPEGRLLCCALLVMLAFAWFSKCERARRALAAASSLAIALHLLMGQYDWFHRYEIYIWAFSVSTLLYLGQPLFSRVVNRDKDARAIGKTLVLATLGTALICWPYIHGLALLPIASNNIFEQHYQMHRLVIHYYRKPVAVHDFGYVSYGNENYVLDLSGVASLQSLKHKDDEGNPAWMNESAKANNVELAMIYPNWFKKIPDGWIKVGELYLSKRIVTSASNILVFYATGEVARSECFRAMRQLQKVLPHEIIMRFY